MYGYHKRMLRVDLSGRKVETQPLEEETIRKYMGGLGLGLKFLHEETGPGTDPLSEKIFSLSSRVPARQRCSHLGPPSSGVSLSAYGPVRRLQRRRIVGCRL